MITTARPSKTETMILLRSCANTPYPVESSKLKVKSESCTLDRTTHNFELSTLPFLNQFHITHCQADMIDGFQHTGRSRTDKRRIILNAPHAVYHSRLAASIMVLC